ncbi:radical SAM protein [Mucilaginibacter sabulilitoris]|uniref:Radical SAM protein n=1 Tax=Mucilaginibacter sabulilitoris TaxID=1173583 RepID=A0ABZ0TIK4_9SPHI|nr:radical SAM protein [Mucilaginibacter sabulilitoris]WPU91549.1 radical SAM protein [Mucilaginibacter sabulilitoris]
MAFKSNRIQVDRSLYESFEEFVLNRTPFFPKFLEIFLTDTCNHNCPFCISADYRENKRNLPLTLVKKIADDMSGYPQSSIRLCGGGEPLLHPQIEEVLQYFFYKNCSTSIVTNGHLLVGNINNIIGEICREVRISVDAGNAQIYAVAHGVKERVFEKLLNNIRQLVANKGIHKYPVIELSFVVNAYNLASLPDFIELAVELKVDRINITMNTNDAFSDQRMLLKRCEELLPISPIGLEISIHDSPADFFQPDCTLLCPAVILNGLIDSRGYYFPSCHHVRDEHFVWGKLNDCLGLKALVSSEAFIDAQYSYIFKRCLKLKKLAFRPDNLLLVNHLIQSAVLKERASRLLLD